MANLPDLFRTDRSLFGDVFSDMDRFVNNMTNMWAPYMASRSLGMPRMDVEESNDAYLMTFEVPGFKEDEIKIDLEGNVLTISAERNAEEKDEGRQSRRYSSFTRSFTLPSSVSAEQIEASCENGLLEIYVPKVGAAKAQSIQIQKGAGGFSQRLKGAQQDVGGDKAGARQEARPEAQTNPQASAKTAKANQAQAETSRH